MNKDDLDTIKDLFGDIAELIATGVTFVAIGVIAIPVAAAASITEIGYSIAGAIADKAKKPSRSV